MHLQHLHDNELAPLTRATGTDTGDADNRRRKDETGPVGSYEVAPNVGEDDTTKDH
jgi:hypothetical protein